VSFVIDTALTCYLMPDDHAEAEQRYLELLHAPGETWLIAYSFTLTDAVDEIIAAHRAGVPLHLYLDHSQSTGKAEQPVVASMVQAGVEVTIGTSTSGTAYICHTKGLVTDAAGGPQCWEGSVNFSRSGWLQVNTAMNFADSRWRDRFVAQFNTLRHFAWTQERDLQVMPGPPADMSAAEPRLPTAA
jgi:hypothetical protein